MSRRAFWRRVLNHVLLVPFLIALFPMQNYYSNWEVGVHGYYMDRAAQHGYYSLRPVTCMLLEQYTD